MSTTEKTQPPMAQGKIILVELFDLRKRCRGDRSAPARRSAADHRALVFH